jgi:RNA polymerase sigma-70 factor (ECF subfamily)
VIAQDELERLLKGCLAEDYRAQRALFERFAPRLFAVSLRYARSRAEAEDLLQDAFIKIFDNISKFEGKGSFEGWMRRIVVNTALKNYSRIRFQRESVGIETVPEQDIPPSVLSQLNEQELLQLIEKLPEGYRLVFNLVAIEGYSHAEVGKMLHIEESTSRSQLTKARQTLQRYLQNIDNQEKNIRLQSL